MICLNCKKKLDGKVCPSCQWINQEKGIKTKISDPIRKIETSERIAYAPLSVKEINSLAPGLAKAITRYFNGVMDKKDYNNIYKNIFKISEETIKTLEARAKVARFLQSIDPPFPNKDFETKNPLTQDEINCLAPGLAKAITRYLNGKLKEKDYMNIFNNIMKMSEETIKTLEARAKIASFFKSINPPFASSR